MRGVRDEAHERKFWKGPQLVDDPSRGPATTTGRGGKSRLNNSAIPKLQSTLAITELCKVGSEVDRVRSSQAAELKSAPPTVFLYSEMGFFHCDIKHIEARGLNLFQRWKTELHSRKTSARSVFHQMPEAVHSCGVYCHAKPAHIGMLDVSACMIA